MKSSHLFAAAVILSFVAACETKAPHEEQPAVREGLTGQIKARTSSGVDGGASTRVVAVTQMVQPPTIPYTATVTNTAIGTGTVTAVGSIITVTTTGSVTNTVTRTASATKTLSATGVVTATFTGTKTGTLTSSGSKTATSIATGTATWTGTYLGTGTATGTKTLTGTMTGTATLTGTLSITATGTKTNTGTKSATGTTVGTGSGTTTLTYTAAPTTTATSTATTTGTNTATVTKTATIVITSTATSTTTTTNLCYGTWAFCDNFETGNGSGWNVQQGPVQNFAVVGDGSKVYRENDPTASQIYISRAQVGMAWMDSTAEASLKPLSFSSSTATVSLWGRYDATWNADCGYYVSLRGDGKVALGKRVIGVNTAIGSPVAVPGGISAGTWYDVKLAIQGTTLTAYVNGTQLLTQTDTSCTSGSVGVGSLGASFEADDVRVTAPTTNACVQGWAGTTCGAFCTYETTQQSDRAGCDVYLDCYANHGCSPETCGGQDDVCGVNVLNPWGTASKEVADQVYKCLGCAGSVNCANPKYYNGTVCADGNPCTWGDTCQNKVCVPDPNRNTQCSASDQCHDVGTCSTTTGMCSNPAKLDGTLCDDGIPCTKDDQCTTGACAGTPVTCPASDQCHGVGTCNAADGTCSSPTLSDNTSCDDGNACTADERCNAGVCSGGKPIDCSVNTVGTNPLEPPITIADTISIRDTFTWQNTAPLKNFTADGPALYYAIIYVQSPADLQALDDLDVQYDPLPLFDVERAKWMGQTGSLSPGFDGTGAFVFAVIPGFTYNIIREAALCSDPAQAQEVFKVIALRDVPVPEAVNPDGTLSYKYLGTEGFRYRSLPNCPDSEVQTTPGDTDAQCDPVTQLSDPSQDPEIAAIMAAQSGSGLTLACEVGGPDGGTSDQQPFSFGIGKAFKKLAKKAVSVCHKVADLGRKGLAVVSKWFKGSAYLTVNLQLQNSDPGFGNNTVFTRAWGKNRGSAAPLTGVEVRVLQKISYSLPRITIPSISIDGYKTPSITSPKISGVIPFDSLCTGHADQTGSSTIKVVKNSTTGVCVMAENEAAKVMDWIFPQQVCSFKNPLLSASDLKGNATITAPLNDGRLNILAQFTEGRAYLQATAGYTPKQAQILVGWAANLLSAPDNAGDHRAYAPCFGFPNSQNPYAAIMSVLQNQVQKRYVEPTLRKGADLMSEGFDGMTNALSQWVVVQTLAADTPAAVAVNSAVNSIQQAVNATSAGRSSAIDAASAGVDFVNATKYLAQLQNSKAAQNLIETATAAVNVTLETMHSATQAANIAIGAAASASAAAKTAAQTAVAQIAAGDPAAAAAIAAAGALSVSDSLVRGAADAGALALSTVADLVGKTVAQILGIVGGEILDVILSDVDIVIPDGPSMQSRGVATHEYGHFVLCDMMYHTDPQKFSSAWTDTLATTVGKQILKLDMSGDANAYINEAWADSFAAQVAGGTNYFGPVQSFRTKLSDGSWRDKMNWCSGQRSLEDNFGGSGVIGGTAVPKLATSDSGWDGYSLQIARVASILHDAFDGNNSDGVSDVPDNCNEWESTSSNGTTQVVADPTSQLNTIGSGQLLTLLSPPVPEEVVSLPGSARKTIVANWLGLEGSNAVLEESTFFQGLSKTMTDAGFGPCDVCRVYLLHQGNDTCPSYAPQGGSYCGVTCPSGDQVDSTSGVCIPIPIP